MTSHTSHRFADLYPLMDQPALEELANSIARSGLREPIVLHADGSVLDGRNRLRACQVAGVEPRFRDFKGSDAEALDFVVDTNSARRHLTESQRALVAAKLVGFGHGGVRTRGDSTTGLTHKQAGAKFGIGERTVRDGKLVVDYAPEDLSADVERGLVAVRAAAELIRAAGKDKVLVAEYHRLRRASGSTEWYTPPHILNLATEVLGAIDLDPASNPGEPWVTAGKHFTKEVDGLAQSWIGRVWLNPPWDAQGSPGRWVAKLVEEYERGSVSEAICLLPARVNTVWMDRLAPFARCFVRGRLRFGDSTGDAPFPVAIVYLGENTQRFVDVFSQVGSVYGHLPPRAL